jgi:heat shock protein HslJ
MPSWTMRAAWAALLGVLLSGCGDSSDERASTGPASFEGIPWVLTAGLDAPGAATYAPSAAFEDGKVTGSTGCNRYSAPFTQAGDRLEIGTIASTQMACEAPATAVEREFLDALGRVARWRSDGDALVLADEDGAELLRFGALSPKGSWVATSFRQRDAVSSVLLDTEITATFAQEGTLTGSAGCNPYRAGYTTDGGAITIEAPVATKKACTAPDGVMEQEQAYLAALPRAERYRVEGQQLTLLAADGTIVATYRR